MLFRFLQANPAVRLVFSLILGVLIGNCLSFSLFFIATSVVFLFCVLLILNLLNLESRVIFGIFVTLFFVALGIFLVQRMQENYALPENLQTHFVKAVVRSEPIEKSKSTSVVLEVGQLQRGDKIEKTHFKILVYFPKDSILKTWQYGDTILTKLHFSDLPKVQNPYAFDYGELLVRRQIYATAFGRIATTKHLVSTDFSLFRVARATQKRLSEILATYIENEKVIGFLQAITLGDKTSLSPEVRVDFANAGVVHILAVSGLHVGILYLLVNFAFGFLRKTRKSRIVLAMIGLVVIWSFAFISGLSVSILRAAIMFSVLQLSILTLRPYHIFNSIAISAILVLLLNPFYLFELGFQLSYSAVLGIVTFVPMWNKKVLKNKYLERLKQLLLVSLSAQLGVAPLVLHCFHQLPTYFLLGNLIVLLLAPFLLGGSLLVLLFSKVPILAKSIAFLVSWLTKFCMFSVNGIAELPYAIWLNYSLDFWEMLLLYAVLVAIVFYVFKRNTRYFHVFLFALFCFSTYGILRNYNERNQQIFVVHSVKGKSCCNLIDGRKARLFQQEKLDEKEQEYAVKPLFERKNIKRVEEAILVSSENVVFGKSSYKRGHFVVKGRHLVVCAEKLGKCGRITPIDMLILSKTGDYKVALQNYEPQLIVLDSSFGKSKSQKLAEELLALHYRVHNVNVDGAFVLN